MPIRSAGRLSGVFFILFTLATSLPLMALSSQELNKVTILNETGTALEHVFFRPADSAVWGVDLLGSRSFKYGTILGFYLHYFGTSLEGDFLAYDARGAAFMVRSFKIREDQPNVLEFSVRHLVPNLKKPPLVRVYITNATNRIISYLFCAPQKSAHWGFDLLSEASQLNPGASTSHAVPAGSTINYFEVFAITKDHARVQKRVEIGAEAGEVFIDLTVEDLM